MSTVKERNRQQHSHDFDYYSKVGQEYYDAERHPTCAAFGEASFALLKQSVPPEFGSSGQIISDIGAGQSVVAQLLGNRIDRVKALYLIDNSPEMLGYSKKLHFSNVVRCITSASEIDSLGVHFDFVVGGLGDPYNDVGFWKAVSRSLCDDGVCFYTTPSFEWASTYRSTNLSETPDSALFELRDGQRVHLPSFIFNESEQTKLMNSFGLAVQHIEHFKVSSLSSVPKKLTHLHTDTPVVTLYKVSKKTKMK